MQITPFTGMLIDANGIDPRDFQCWVFHPGMLFNSPDKWWGDFGQRDFPHEGLDFCLYQDRSHRVHSLDYRTRIPAMHDGVVRAVFADYLGKAIVIEHAGADGANPSDLSIYAHTTPSDGIVPGTGVRQGDIIATIADTRRSKARIAPHLHYTRAVASTTLNYEPFVWNVMRDPDRITLMNPLQIIDWPHQVLSFADPNTPAHR